jgi:hypothetical protein
MGINNIEGTLYDLPFGNETHDECWFGPGGILGGASDRTLTHSVHKVPETISISHFTCMVQDTNTKARLR